MIGTKDNNNIKQIFKKKKVVTSMKLKDLLKVIRAYNTIHLSFLNGEEFTPLYSDLEEYVEHEVLEIQCANSNTLIITLHNN